MIGFVDISGAARYLSRSPRWIRQHVHEIRHFRPGGQILFDIDDLKKWMSHFVVEPANIDIAGLLKRVTPSPRRRGSLGRFRGEAGA
jgi:hypothetical protein